MDEDIQNKWAEFRFGVIAPLVCRRLDEAQRRETRRNVLQTAYTTPVGDTTYVAERTLRTWLSKYKLHGFDGLKRAPSKTAGKCDAIPEEILKAAADLRLELRTRSIRGILSVLQAQGFEVDKISPSTLNFHLNRLGATKEKHASEKGSFQLFQKDHANDLWQADCSGGVYLPDPLNKGQFKQTQLISVIDDATRVVTHAQFYFDQQVPSLFDCFRKGLLTHGKCSQLYTDNGPCFKARDLARTCARLGIELKHSEEYTPEGRGKIERHIGTVKAGFLEEAKHSGLQTLDELNEFFFAWLDKEYHNSKHKSLGLTPKERWQQDETKGIVKLVTPEQIRDALMVEANRTVTKQTALIRVNNRLYQAGRELAGRKVRIRWEADRRNPTIEIWLNGKLVEIAGEIVPGSDIDYSKRPQRHRKPEKVPKVLLSSKQYRKSLVSAYRKETQPPSLTGEYMSEVEFQELVARVLERQLPEEELAFLSAAFAELSPVRDTPTESVLLKAVSAKGSKMHLRYYCDLLMQSRLLERR